MVKVTYFDLPGAAEPIRLLLAYGGENFEDNRIDFQDWPKIKLTMPFGQMPLYEEDGKMINQSVAICRYLGNKYKLIGDDDWENLEVDAIADTFRDLVIKAGTAHYEQSASAKQKMKAEIPKTIDFYLEKLDNVAKENNGHLAAKKLTWADFYWTGLIDYMCLIMEVNLKEKYPNLEAVRQNVLKLPAITKSYEDHPIDWVPVRQWLNHIGTPSQK